MKKRIILALMLAASTASAEAPRVAADILPVHGLVSRVMEGIGTPDLILPPGASPHGYSMRPSEAAALERAEVVFWIGHELTPWLEGPIESLAGDARHVSLLELPDTVLREGEEGHEESHDHDHGEIDPHAWLDPENGRVWLSAIAKVLAEADPDNAAAYAANAQAADRELEELTDEMRVNLKALETTSFAVFHDALGYLEDRFGLSSQFSIMSSDAEKPSPRRIANLRQQVTDDGVGLIFGEEQASEALVETVFEGHDVSFCRVDILGSEIAAGPKHYWILLNNLALKMEACAGS